MDRRLLRFGRQVFAAIEDAVFPRTCGGCGIRGTWLCDRCRRDVRPIGEARCARCGQATGRAVLSCRWCQDWRPELVGMQAAFVFDGPIRRSIHLFKYQGEHARGRFLGELLADDVAGSRLAAESWSLVGGVPLHSRRRRRRGFNQADILAAAVASRLGIPLTRQLRRTRDTPTQVGLGAAGRHDNVQGAFTWTGPPLDGRSVLLVDDVITTGSTMLAVMNAVLDAGADRAAGIALARELFKPRGEAPSV